MTTGNASPIALAERRLAWLDQRQRVLAQNVANADTPLYRPRDVVPFTEHLSTAFGGAGVQRTHALHFAERGNGTPVVREDRRVGEATPNGNAVSLDREAVRVAETDTAHALAFNLHRAFLGMFRTALGRT